PNCAVGAPSRKMFSIRTQGHTPDLLCVPSEHQELFAGFGVKCSRRLIHTDREKTPTVGTHCNIRNTSLVRTRAPGVFPALQVPHPNIAITRPTCDVFPLTNQSMNDPAAMERKGWLVVLHLPHPHDPIEGAYREFFSVR